MPYLVERIKKLIDDGMDPASSGELNYKITMEVLKFLRSGIYKGGHYDYARINQVIGAMECAKLEFYRRIAVPYEDDKIKENGDVY